MSEKYLYTTKSSQIMGPVQVQISLEHIQDNKLLIENSLNSIVSHPEQYTKEEIVQKIAFIEYLVEEI